MSLKYFFTNDGRQVYLEFSTEDLDQELQFCTWMKPIVFLKLDQFDVKLREDDSADVEVEVAFEQNVQIGMIAGVVCIDSDGLQHPLQILLDVHGHLTINLLQ